MSYRYLSEINPRFIYVWGGGFGYGPKIFGGSYDILGQAHAGLASVTGMHEFMGGHATKQTNWVIDWQSGNLITCSILAAIHHRRKTGLGTMIEFSQVQVPTRMLGHTLPMYGKFGIVRQRWGNWDTQLAAHGIILCGKSDFPDADNPQDKFCARYVMVSAFQDEDFKELCAITGNKGLFDKYKSHNERVEGEAQVEIYTALEKWAEDKSRSEVAKILQDAGILAEPVRNDREIYESPHFRERGTVRWLDDPLFGDMLVHCGYSCGHMEKTPRRINWHWRPVGADNKKIYRDWLGISAQLKSKSGMTRPGSKKGGGTVCDIIWCKKEVDGKDCDTINYLDPYYFWNWEGKITCAECGTVYYIHMINGFNVQGSRRKTR